MYIGEQLTSRHLRFVRAWRCCGSSCGVQEDIACGKGQDESKGKGCDFTMENDHIEGTVCIWDLWQQGGKPQG